MKTTIQIDLLGQTFVIDEEGCRLLQEYLTGLSSFFHDSPEGRQITEDVERRIAAYFATLRDAGHSCIDAEHVREILKQIGRPDEHTAPNEADEGEAHEAPHTEWKEEGSYDQQETHQQQAHWQESRKDTATSAYTRRFMRDPNDKYLGGVLSGLCWYFGWSDPTLVRILFVLLVIFTSGWLAVFYLIAWVVAPLAATPEDRHEMKGHGTVAGVYESTAQDAPAPRTSSGCMGGCLKVCLICLIGVLCLFLLSIVCLCLFTSFGVFSQFTDMNFSPHFNIL